MAHYSIYRLADRPELLAQAANWFHEKWGLPIETYEESMRDCLAGREAVPQWYVALSGDAIIAGAGVIENDFHNRKDLTPNVCAVYTEPACRRQGLARALLAFLCADIKARGIDTLYLATEHTSFYERCGWQFLCMVQCDGETGLSRMYVHRA